MVARRKIKAGEQATFDYATSEAFLKFEFDCSCNSANCRQHISDEDFRIMELQQKYAGHMLHHCIIQSSEN